MPRKIRLLTPGPTMIPERVQHVMSQPILYHRSPEFKPVFAEARERMKKLFATNQEVLLIASSGSGVMEATITNLFRAGDKVLIVEGGKFGKRWRDLAQAFGLNPIVLEVEWGKAVRLEEIERTFQQHPDTAGLLMQACETSTGVLHPLQAIAQWKKKAAPNMLLCVDGITAVGAVECPMDQWGIDVMLCGSQKALMLPPGLAMIALSENAWKRCEGKGLPRFYFDLKRERKNQVEATTTAWTPAISLIMGLVESLKMLEEEGYESIYKRHEKLARATRKAGQALGLELLSDSPSPSITAFKVPQGIDGEKLVKTMRDVHGYTIAGGQDHLKGKIFRIGHMGYIDEYDLVGALAALERTLQGQGWKVPSGSLWGRSVGAFLEALGA